MKWGGRTFMYVYIYILPQYFVSNWNKFILVLSYLLKVATQDQTFESTIWSPTSGNPVHIGSSFVDISNTFVVQDGAPLWKRYHLTAFKSLISLFMAFSLKCNTSQMLDRHWVNPRLNIGPAPDVGSGSVSSGLVSWTISLIITKSDAQSQY